MQDFDVSSDLTNVMFSMFITFILRSFIYSLTLFRLAPRLCLKAIEQGFIMTNMSFYDRLMLLFLNKYDIIEDITDVYIINSKKTPSAFYVSPNRNPHNIKSPAFRTMTELRPEGLQFLSLTE
jgi:hypothetical protein